MVWRRQGGVGAGVNYLASGRNSKANVNHVNLVIREYIVLETRISIEYDLI